MSYTVQSVTLVREPTGIRYDSRPTVSAPRETAAFLYRYFEEECEADKETFVVLLLSVRHKLLGIHRVAVGCLTSSLVHPREVFRPAVLAPAAAVVVAHNHPSGDPEPSGEDVALTRRLVAGGELLGIELLDHLVIGDGRYVSLKERGVL